MKSIVAIVALVVLILLGLLISNRSEAPVVEDTTLNPNIIEDVQLMTSTTTSEISTTTATTTDSE